MALSDIALITVEDARIYANQESDEKPDDAWFEAVIDGISARVQQHTGCKYRPYTGTAAERVFPYTSGTRIAIDECTDVTLVEYNTTPNDDDGWTEFEDTDWLVEPLNEDVKTMIRLAHEIPGAGQPSGWEGLGLHVQSDRTIWPSQVQAEAQKFVAVRVTAKWGVEDVPANVQLAVMLWIRQLLLRDVLILSDELAEATISRGTMPADVRGILDGLQSAAGGVEAV